MPSDLGDHMSSIHEDKQKAGLKKVLEVLTWKRKPWNVDRQTNEGITRCALKH